MSYADQYAAVLSTGVYFAGLNCFKAAAGGMPELRGARPVQLSVVLVTDPLWLSGALLLMSGALLQVKALDGLTLLQAGPLFMAGLGTLLLLALLGRGERLGAREWGAVLLLAASTGLIAHSVDGGPAAPGTTPAPGAVTAIAVPSLLLPATAFLLGDLVRKGTHRRPVNGVALAISVGLLTGTAELMLNGMADQWTDPGRLVGSPQFYLFLTATPLALGQLQIALQRCRLAIVGLVATATAKTYLLVAALTVYGEPWPVRRVPMALGLLSAVLAITVIPHHETGPARPADRKVKEHRP